MAETGRRFYCPRCGARLRRGQPFGTECHVQVVAGVAQGLHIPGHLLGFPDVGPPDPERAP